MDKDFFLKRPSHDEDDEVLEGMGKEFSQRKCTPCAEVKGRPLTSLSSSHVNNISKGSPQPSSSFTPGPEVVSVPVLFDIVERDVISLPVSLPKSYVRNIPSVQMKELALRAKRNKKSIFQQQMDDLERQNGCQSRSTSSNAVPNEEVLARSFIVDGSGLGSEEGKVEAEHIHKENINKLSEMSYNEIVEQQNLLKEKLDPGIIEFLRSRRKNSSVDSNVGTSATKAQKIKTFRPENKVIENLSGDVNETVLQKSGSCDYDGVLLERLQDLEAIDHSAASKKTISSNPEKVADVCEDTGKNIVDIPEEELPIDPKEAGKWLHMNKVEKDKLAWMTFLPKPKPVDLKSGYAARFDLEGRLLSRDQDIPTHEGLHHHSNEPEVAGYSIEELFTLSRSSFPSQRISALNVLAHVLENYWDGRLDECFESSLLNTLLSSGIVPLLRYAVDDSAVPLVAAAVLAIHHLLICKADELCLDWTFCWPNGHLSPFLTAEDSEPDVNLSELTDTNIIKLDVIKGFLRMDILARIRYILRVICPAFSVCQLVIEICIRIARHSYESAKQVAKFPGLLDAVFRKFLPLDWRYNHQNATAPDYYCPMPSAMKLIRVIASASRELASMLVKNYHLTESLKCYLAIDPSDKKLPPADVQKLMVESLRTWRTFLCYGLCAEIFLDMFPLIMRHFLFCQSLSLNQDVEKHIYDYEYAANLIKALGGIVEYGFQSQNSSSIEGAVINWKSLTDMCRPCLKHWLRDFSVGDLNHLGVSLLATALDFLTSLCHLAADYPIYKNDILSVAEDIIDNHLVPCLKSQSFLNMLSHLSSSSLLLYSGKSGKKRDSKVLTSLGCISWEDDIIPLLKTESPIPLVLSVTRLIVAVGDLQSQKKFEAAHILLAQPSVTNYLKKIASTPFFPPHWFDKFETECIYHLLEIFIIIDSERTELWYRVALSLMTCLRTPFEQFIEKLTEKIIFNSKFLCCTEAERNLSSENVNNVRNFYCCYFLKPDTAKNDRLSFENTLTSLFKEGWPYDPIFDYYEQSKTSNKIPSSEMLMGVKCCLQWASISAKLKYSAFSLIPISIQYCSLCMVFLMDTDLFMDNEVQQLLSVNFQNIVLSKQQVSLKSFKWKNILHFGEIYSELLAQFESVSYGNHLFAIFVVFPLQQCYPSKWKELLLAEHPQVVRFLGVPLSKLPVPVKNYLEPLEKDEEVLKEYFRLLTLGILNQSRCPLVFLMAVHHLHHYIIADDDNTEKSKLRITLRHNLRQSKNKEIANVIYQYSSNENT